MNRMHAIIEHYARLVLVRASKPGEFTIRAELRQGRMSLIIVPAEWPADAVVPNVTLTIKPSEVARIAALPPSEILAECEPSIGRGVRKLRGHILRTKAASVRKSRQRRRR